MASDAFLKIDGIPGESTDTAFPETIEILSYSHGVSMPVNEVVSTGGNRTTGRVSHQDLTITKVVDKTSPKLMISCCNGKHIPNITLTTNRAGEDKIKFMEIKMDDVIVANVTYGGSTGAGLPTETVSFAYAKVTWTYTETDHKTGKKKGDITANWSLTENKGS